jgi:hypothetical protein
MEEKINQLEKRVAALEVQIQKQPSKKFFADGIENSISLSVERGALCHA